MCKNKRIINHHLDDQDTEIHFLSTHTFVDTQMKTIRKMHGNCKIVYNPQRYETYDDFKKQVLSLVHIQNIVGIYLVIKQEWRKKFVEEYIMTDKVNGTLIGWFVGFGRKDDIKKVTQSLPYIWHGCMMKFKIEETFGRSPIVRSFQKKIASSKYRPQKTKQHRVKN